MLWKGLGRILRDLGLSSGVLGGLQGGLGGPKQNILIFTTKTKALGPSRGVQGCTEDAPGMHQGCTRDAPGKNLHIETGPRPTTIKKRSRRYNSSKLNFDLTRSGHKAWRIFGRKKVKFWETSGYFFFRKLKFSARIVTRSCGTISGSHLPDPLT